MNTKKILSMLVVGFMLQACAPMTYNIKEPEPSKVPYKNTETVEQLALVLNDSRPDHDKVFSHGVLNADLLLSNVPVEPISFLKVNAAKEMKARNMLAEFADAGVTIDINKFKVLNHRTNAYTPFITMTMLSADVDTQDGKRRIAAFIKRGKTPVWSFQEIIEPTFNQPLDLIVKEFVAKLNRLLFNQKVSDEQVQKLTHKLLTEKHSDTSYMDVYELGYSNNNLAADALIELAKHDDEYIRIAAISGLGSLQVENAMPLLKEIYSTAKTWQDRGMALKSMGDIGNEEARDFLEKARAELFEKDNKERVWSNEIISLYLD